MFLGLHYSVKVRKVFPTPKGGKKEPKKKLKNPMYCTELEWWPQQVNGAREIIQLK